MSVNIESEREVRCLEDATTFRPEDLTIKEVYRFEGNSDGGWGRCRASQDRDVASPLRKQLRESLSATRNGHQVYLDPFLSRETAQEIATKRLDWPNIQENLRSAKCQGDGGVPEVLKQRFPDR